MGRQGQFSGRTEGWQSVSGGGGEKEERRNQQEAQDAAHNAVRMCNSLGVSIWA